MRVVTITGARSGAPKWPIGRLAIQVGDELTTEKHGKTLTFHAAPYITAAVLDDDGADAINVYQHALGGMRAIKPDTDQLVADRIESDYQRACERACAVYLDGEPMAMTVAATACWHHTKKED